MGVRLGYKQTDIGVIPTDWNCERIGDAAATSANAIVGGPFGSDLVSSDYVPVGVPVIRGQNMSARTVSGDFVFVSPQKAKALQANLAYPGDFIFTQRGTLGQVSVVPEGEFEKYLVSQSQMKVSLDRMRHDAGFVRQFFASREGQAQILASAIQTGVPHTNLGILRAYQFPAPSLSEQRAIAQVLDDVDALLEGLGQLIAKKRLIKRGAMQELLTGNRRLLKVSGSWQQVRAGDIGQFKGGSGFPSHFQGTTAGEFPFFKVSDMNNEGNALFMDAANNYVSDRVRKLISAAVFPRDTIVFAKVGAAVFLERKRILSRASCLDNNMAGFVVDSNRVNVRFMHYLLSNMRLADLVSTTALPSLSARTLAPIDVCLPPLAEQKAIATVLSDMDAEIDALEQRLAKTRAIKEGMMQALLTGRIRLVPPQSAPAAA